MNEQPDLTGLSYTYGGQIILPGVMSGVSQAQFNSQQNKSQIVASKDISIFKKMILWVKLNPWKTTFIGIGTVLILTVIFSKKVRGWIFGTKKPQAQLTGVRKPKKRK